MKIDFDDTKLDKASAKELKAGLAEAQAGLGG